MTKLIGFFDCARIKITQFGMKVFIGILGRHIGSNEVKAIAHSHTSARFLNKQNFSLAFFAIVRKVRWPHETKTSQRKIGFQIYAQVQCDGMPHEHVSCCGNRRVCNFNVHQTVVLRMRERSAAAQRREILFHGNERRDMSKGKIKQRIVEANLNFPPAVARNKAAEASSRAFAKCPLFQL